MRVLLINGSPRAKGNTSIALAEVAKVLETEGIDTITVHIGNQPVRGCMACGACRKNKTYCAFSDALYDGLRAILDEGIDGLVVGSPVYYAGLNGTLKSLLDRVFYARKSFDGKPAAAIAVARRAGTTSTVDIINKYFMISNMPVVSSQYWNMVFGSNGGQAEQDYEGMQTMRMIGVNMAWILKCIEAGKEKGILPPDHEKHVKTNYIR
jgi:multimeric flavodoxin WrbA